MSTLTSAETVWVVSDAQQQVVLICGGEDAPAAAAEWRDRGYRAEPVDAVEVNPA
jgi:hypothetical protein